MVVDVILLQNSAPVVIEIDADLYNIIVEKATLNLGNKMEIT